MIKKYWLIETNDWITNHFGKNPKNGGNPAKDKNEIKNLNFNNEEWEYKEKIWLI